MLTDESNVSSENQTLRAENDALRARLASVLHELGQKIEGGGDGAVEAAADVPAAPAPPTAAALRREMAEAIGATFVAWCRAASPLLSRSFMFERSLRESVAGARVVPLYRSASRFGALSASGPEYWSVETDGEAFLLPQPLSREQFRDADALAFEVASDTRPIAITACRAATLVSEGGTHSVELRGDLR